MSKAPQFYAYAVKDRPDQKGIWTRIGAAWPIKDGEGLTIKLEALPLNGQITLMPPKAKDAAASTFEGEIG